MENEATVICMLLVDEEVWCGCKDKQIRILSTEGQFIGRICEHTDMITALLEAGDYVLSGSLDGTITVNDKKKKKLLLER